MVVGEVWSATQAFPLGLNGKDQPVASWAMLENDPINGVNLGDYWYGAFYSVPAAKGAWELRFTGLWTQTDFVKPPGAAGFINDAIHTNTVRLLP